MKNKTLVIIAFFWVATATGIFLLMLNFVATPGKNLARQLTYWPVRSQLAAPDKKPLLLIFANPYCVCSKATIGELETMMPLLKNRIDIVVLFVRPENRSIGWVKNSLYKSTLLIPGVKTLIDFKYAETDIFGAQTSGQVILFNPGGEKVFSGGITQGRGHQGENLGRLNILSWAAGKKFKREIASVFGCSLREIY